MFGRKKRIAALEAEVTAIREQFDEVVKYYSKQNAAKEIRVEALEGQVRDLEANKKSTTELMKKTTALLELHQKRVAALEDKVAELEAKRVPVISDLTGGGKKEKPVSAKQIMDEWLNGKAEGGEGK
jgi:chromosome segregation ATPase